MGLLYSTVSPTTAGWYSNAPATSLAHRCYWFTWSRSELWKELIQSLFTFKLGVFMTLSSWITLVAVIQLVSHKPIWDLWLDIIVNVLTILSKILMVFVSYEFIVMKFPEYVKDVLTSEMCVSYPMTPNEEIASGVGAIVALCGMVYFIHSVTYARRQQELSMKAVSYDVALNELDLCHPGPGQEMLTGYDVVDSINNRIKQAIQKFISGKKPVNKTTRKTTVTTGVPSDCVERPPYPASVCATQERTSSVAGTICHPQHSVRSPRQTRQRRRSTSRKHSRISRRSTGCRRSKRLRKIRVCDYC